MSSVTVFLGREKELELLRRSLTELGRGRGGVVLVEGEPGIGKSSLLRNGLADTSGTTVCWGTADELGQPFPLRALLECFEPEHRAEVIGAAHTGQGEWIGVVDDPVLAALERLLSLVDRMCTAGPVALVLDDLHWADDTSLLAFSRLARLTTQLPLLLVTATRSVPNRPGLGQLRRSLLAVQPVLITLNPLPADEATELAGAVAGAPAGPRLSELVGNAGGNPLYIQELVTGLLHEDRIEVRGMAELSTSPGIISAPASLSAAIDDRLSFLPEPTLAMLRIASLFDTAFSFEDLATVSRRAPAELLTDVENAVAAGVLETCGEQHVFRHPLIRAVLHDSTGAGFRTALHREAARTLANSGASPERVAGHLLFAPFAVRDEWALDWLSREAHTLAARSPKITADLMQQALEVLDDHDPRRESLERWLVTILGLLRDFEGCEKLARRVLQRTSDPDCADQMTWRLGRSMFGMQRVPEVIDLLTGALDGRSDTRPWTARLRALLAVVVSSVGRHEEGEPIALQAATEAEASGDGYAIAYASHACSLVVDRVNPARTRELIDRGLAAVPSGPDGTDLRLLLLTNRVDLLIKSDELEDADTRVREALDIAERTGTARLANIRVIAAQARFLTGRWDDANAELEPVDELRDQLRNYESLVPVVNGMVGLIAIHRDDLRTAAACLDATRRLVIVPGELRKKSDYLMLARASLAERRGHRTQAIAALAPATDPEAAKELTKRLPILPTLARLALAENDFTTVTTAVQAAMTEAERHPLPGVEVSAGWCRGLVAGDAAVLRATASYYRTAGRPLEVGLVTEDLAELLAKQGETAEARTALTDAVGCYTGLGATWDIRRAERRLAWFGVRRGRTGPGKQPTIGWAALTPTELTVARLVADGLSNSDIAERLFLSRRTVHTHISHILTKLGARSRVDITRHVLTQGD